MTKRNLGLPGEGRLDCEVVRPPPPRPHKARGQNSPSPVPLVSRAMHCPIVRTEEKEEWAQLWVAANVRTEELRKGFGPCQKGCPVSGGQDPGPPLGSLSLKGKKKRESGSAFGGSRLGDKRGQNPGPALKGSHSGGRRRGDLGLFEGHPLSPHRLL